MPPALIGLDLDGRDQLEPGESAQFTMMATFSNDTTANVTTETTWKVLEPLGVLAISPTGLVTTFLGSSEVGVARVGVISGEFRGTVLKRTITVVARPGTFRLGGIVTFGRVGVPDARVEVVSGPFAGKMTTTNGFGNFDLLGVVGDMDVRVSKNGYIDRRHQVTVTGNQTVSWELDGLGPPLDVAGVYALTITAGTCEVAFPAELKIRVYTATITQSGAAVTLILSGADFSFPELPNWYVWDRLLGTAEPGGVTFVSDPWGDGSYSIVERVDPHLQLLFGTAGEIVTLAMTPRGFSGTLSYMSAQRQPGFVFAGACRQAHVSFERSR
jgi:hypothetical protein